MLTIPHIDGHPIPNNWWFVIVKTTTLPTFITFKDNEDDTSFKTFTIPNFAQM
jgi:hypothetical protein